LSSLKKLASQTAIYGLSSIVGRLINYLLVPLYTNVFSTEQYGIVTEMYAYVTFLIVILTYGMETAFFRFSTIEGEDKKNIYSTAIISILSTSSLFILLAILFSHPIANWLRYPNHNEYVIWFAIIIGLDAFSSIPLAKLRQENKALKFAIVNLISILINILLNVFWVYYCRKEYELHGTDSNWLIATFYHHPVGVGYIFIANLIASIAKTVLLLPTAGRINLNFSPDKLKQMLLYSLPLLIAGLAGMVDETIDRIMLKFMLIDKLGQSQTLSQLGIYGACYKISIIITISIQAFRYAAEPFFFSQQKNLDAKEQYSKIMNYFVIACSLVFLGIMMYIDIVIRFVGKDFREGADVIPVLLLANICLGIYFNLSIWYKLTGHTLYGAFIAIGGAFVTIFLNYMLIPIMGYMGSAWTKLVCYALIMVISYLIGQKFYPVNYSLFKISGYLSLSVTMYFLNGILLSLIDFQTLIMKLSFNTLFIIAFIGIVYIFELRNKPKPNIQP
jgi:O-antigen/teichoic acid export membrane protein